VVKAAASFEEAVVNGDLSHDGSYRLTEHCLNARRVLVARAGIGVGKQHKDSSEKIDAAYAAMLAWQARLDALAKGAIGKTAGRGRVIVLT
jgi:phage terminase large subunit-like protein